MLPGNTPALMGAAAPYTGNDAYTVLLLHFEGAHTSTVITDSSPTLKGNASVGGTNFYIYNPGSKFGSQLYSAATGYCTFPNHADWNFGTGDFTVDWWEYRTGVGCAISRDLPSTYSPYLLSYAGGGVRQVYMSSNNASWDIANAKTMGAYTLNVWQHLAITRNGNTFRTFRDGVKQDEWTSSLAPWANSNALCIGACQNGTNYSGSIDELRISKGIARWTANFTPPTAPYGQPQTPAPVPAVKLWLKMDGADGSTVFTDSSPLLRGNATVGGNARIISTQAAYFDGAGDYLSYPDSPDWAFGSGDFTIEMWARWNVLSDYQVLVAQSGPASNYLRLLSTTNALYFQAYDGTTTWQVGLGVAVNTWYHIAFVKKDGILTSYRNGVAQASTPVGTLPDFTSVLTIGMNDTGGTYAFNGFLDDVRITKAAIYTANFTPPATPATPPAPPAILATVGAGTWTVPGDWNNANNSIECIGGGANGIGTPGGGGGAYSKITNLALTPGAIINFNVGGVGGDTWFKDTATVLAKGASGSTGGQASAGVGTVKFNGGNGGNGATGSGGGGAAGPDNHGGNGASPAGRGSGGGGGANGGAASNAPNPGGDPGGTGGVNRLGTGAGGAYGAGSNGGGGGGQTWGGGTTTAAVGGNGTEYDATHGSGGGGGGGVVGGGTGCAGGLFGGGGGGGNGAASGAGRQGLIVIKYTPL